MELLKKDGHVQTYLVDKEIAILIFKNANQGFYLSKMDMPLFSLKNANRVVLLQNKIFSYTRPFCSDKGFFERIVKLLVGESNI